MRFRKLGTLTMISVVASASGAYAADNQRSWNGFYVGGNFGAGWSPTESNNTAVEPRFTSRPATDSGVPLGSRDGIGSHSGYLAGYNWQSSNSPVVLGIEGDQSH